MAGPSVVKGELHGKKNFRYMLGFGLASGVVKVFPVGSLSLARKSTRKKGTRCARIMKWDPKSRDHPIIGLDWAWANVQQLAKASQCDLSPSWSASDATRMHRPAPERSPTSGSVRRGDGHATWDPISSSGHVMPVFSWLISR